MANFPTDGQSGVPINRRLEYAFSQAVSLESIETGGGVLFDVRDNEIIEGVWSIDDTGTIVYFMPEVSLVPNTSYTWTFAGEDDPTVIPVTYSDESVLAESVYITFQTGTSQDVPEEINPSTTDILDVIEDGQTIEERASDVFKVIELKPAHMESFVDVTTSSVSIKFSEALDNTQDFGTLISMVYQPLLRETYLFNDGGFKTHTRRAAPGMESTLDSSYDKFKMPIGTWGLSEGDTVLTWTKDPEQPNFNANAFIRITLDKAIKSANAEALNSDQDEKFYFLTDMYPLLSNVESTLLILNEIEGFVSEEVVLRHLLDKSLTAWNIACKSFSLIEPPRIAQRFVECATIVDLIDQKVIQNEINRGRSIRLSDITVDYAIPRNADASTSTIRKECAREAQELKTQLSFMCGDHKGFVFCHPIMPYDVFRNRMDASSDRKWFNPGQKFNV